ncbi:MAG: imidazole glycerol phosphate synthase subunit HisH, partial [Leptospiraceae bacterium]|nr:imidazole glycerol phosphate synthase subunit HisH [Leptospiraceae bacterium]
GSMAEGKISGLGLIPGHVRRFPAGQIRVPHMGWNTLADCSSGHGLEDDQWMYFIHSYHAADVPADLVLSWTQYGSVRFPSAVKKDNIIATQFHPEKSDRAGLAFLERWVGDVGE